MHDRCIETTLSENRFEWTLRLSIEGLVVQLLRQECLRFQIHALLMLGRQQASGLVRVFEKLACIAY